MSSIPWRARRASASSASDARLSWGVGSAGTERTYRCAGWQKAVRLLLLFLLALLCERGALLRLLALCRLGCRGGRGRRRGDDRRRGLPGRLRRRVLHGADVSAVPAGCVRISGQVMRPGFPALVRVQEVV